MPIPDLLPAASVNLTTSAPYELTRPLWMDPGIPVIISHSPQEIADLVGLSITMNPATYAEVTAYPNLTVYDSQRELSPGTFAPLDIGSGVLGDQTWGWQIAVQLYQLPSNAPAFQQEVVYWTGDGGASQLVPTAFALNTGTCVVVAAGEITTPAMMCCTGLGGTTVMGVGDTTFPPANSYISALEAGGFRVTNTGSLGAAVGMNVAGRKYAAIVWKDPGDTHMKVGFYTGDGLAGRIIPTGIAASHVWVWGRGVCYKSTTDFGAANAVELALEAGGNQVTNLITAIGATSFTVGNNNNINSGALRYVWIAIDTTQGIDAANIFRSFKTTGTAATPDQVSGLGFEVDVAVAERYLTGGAVASQGAYYKSGKAGFQDTPDVRTSTLMSTGAQQSTAPFAVQDVGTGIVDIGEKIATNGDDVYGYAFIGFGEITNFPDSGPFVITCPAGAGVVGTYYTGQIGVSGGTPPYFIVPIAGVVPPGLVISETTGQLSGTPLTVGIYSYTVRVLDATLDPDLETIHTCSLTIAAAGAQSPVTSPLHPIPSVGQGCTTTLPITPV